MYQLSKVLGGWLVVVVVSVVSVVGVVGVVVGTRLGSRWLRQLDPDTLTLVFRVVVTAGAARLIGGLMV